MKIDITITKVASARKQHTCSYCKLKIGAGQAYTKITSRLEDERFPVDIKICHTHQPGLVPLSLLIAR